MRVLALSGSLRTVSINSAFLRAVAQLAPADMEVLVYPALGELPLFNPDLDADLPLAVRQFQQQVAHADALLIASPEYAHGVTGVMKNALDWLVSFEPFADKPVAVINTSPRAHHADEALRETLRTMSANLIEAASVTVPLLGAKLDTAGMVSHPEISTTIHEILTVLQIFLQDLQIKGYNHA